MALNQIFQSAYSARPSEAIVGMLADAFGPRRIKGRATRGLIKAGYGVFKAPTAGGAGTQMLDPGEVYHMPSPAIGVSATAVFTGGTSATGVQTINSAELQPPRQVSITFDANTDWDPTVGVLTGYDHNGQLVSENIAIATSTAPVSTLRYSQVLSFTKPAQTGATGTFSVGVTAITALTVADFKGVAVRQVIKTTIATAGLFNYPGMLGAAATTADYVDGEEVPVLSMGGIWVYSEQAVTDGAPVYLRTASGAGGAVLGAFRTDADTATAVLVPGAYFKRDSAAAGAAWAEFTYTP